jgi:hypothetical protein
VREAYIERGDAKSVMDRRSNRGGDQMTIISKDGRKKNNQDCPTNY